MKEEKIKVLLVSDDLEDRALLDGYLEAIKGADYELTSISRYQDVIRAMRSHDYDIQLVDFHYDNDNGLGLIQLIIEGGSRTPAILLTEKDDKELDIAAMKVGVSDYLVKAELDSLTLERAIRYAIEHSRTEIALRSSEARFRSVIQNLSDIIAILDSDANITYISPSIERTSKMEIAEILGRKLTEFAHPEDVNKLENFIDEIRRRRGNSLLLEWRTVGTDAAFYYVESVGVNLLDDPHVSGIVITTRNINERKILEDQLTHQAFHDPLTALANRVLFRDRVEHALMRYQRQQTPLAVLFLDLDNFKNINDSLGHAAGDELLKSVAERLMQCVRYGDTVARLGGDEFAILLEDTEQANNAVAIAERVLECALEPFKLNGTDVMIGISVGIAFSSSKRETADELLRNADVAMYIAKENGKGCYTIFENKMYEAILSQIELEADMRRAIERGEFFLNYQPIVRLDTKKVAGFEALVRWNHPVHGMILPESFIPLAEQTGLILPLGRWIIEESCRQVKLLSRKYGRNFTMTINISGKQLLDPGFPNDIASALDAFDTIPSLIILEITESVMMQNTEDMLKRLMLLKSIGVRLAIDDFGTGYSSLSYLQQFPIDILKIDKSFTKDVNRGPEKSAVARTIINLSDTLQLSTIAEGIERAEQIPTLESLGCKFGQGFYFAHPLSEDQLSRINQIENLNIDFESDHLIYPELTLIFNKTQEFDAVSKPKEKTQTMIPDRSN
ncbi:MAG: EAL domain-containing protein [Pyrinomonadaceae bacterium]|nr:EAL domain-containing protein [Pyrinomonadaceae bacterium]